MKKFKIFVFALICSSSLIFGQVQFRKNNLSTPQKENIDINTRFKKTEDIYYSVHSNKIKYNLPLTSISNTDDLFRSDSTKNASLYDNFFFYSTIGLYEISSIGLGYNINENWGIALKANIFLLRSRFLFNGAAGVGIKIHRRIFKDKKFRLFDTINLEASIGSNNFKRDITKCKEVQLDLASESDGYNGLNFYYSAGVGYSFENRSGALLMPSIKLGLIYIF